MRRRGNRRGGRRAGTGGSGGKGSDAGIVIGFPLLAGTVVSFLPAQVLTGLPAVFRPLLGNGFVVGVLTAFLLEHVIFRRREKGG